MIGLGRRAPAQSGRRCLFYDFPRRSFWWLVGMYLFYLVYFPTQITPGKFILTFWFTVCKIQLMQLNEYIVKNSLPQNELAERAGVKPAFLSLLVAGKRKPSPSTALRIEQATGGAVTRMELLYPEQKGEGAETP